MQPAKALKYRTRQLNKRWFGPSRRRRIWKRYEPASMLPKPRAIDSLEQCAAVRVPGVIVECGVWRGGMSAAMAATLPGRKSYLLDSFEGLPEPSEADGERAAGWGGNIKAETDSVAEVMRRTGQDFEIVPGWFDATVPAVARHIEPIAVLRLDGDWYESTMVCLEHLFPLVVEGGLLLIDDYQDWEGCTRAVHDYLSRERRVEPIRESRGAFYLWKT